MVQKYLFFLENDYVTVSKYNSSKVNKFEAIKNLGEEQFKLEADFLLWWKNSIDYSEEDFVDICIISDKAYDNFNENMISNMKKNIPSEWTIERVKKYLEDKLEYQYICLVLNNGEKIRVNTSSKIFGDNTEKIFYTNIGGEKNAKKEEQTRDIKNYEEHSPFMMYYIDEFEKRNTKKEQEK